MPVPITIAIDTLVIQHESYFNVDAFSSALNGELTRLLASTTLQAGVWQAEVVQAELSAGADSAMLGVQVAQLVYRQMHGER